MDADLGSWTTEGQNGWIQAAREVEEEQVGPVSHVSHTADLSMRIGGVNHLKLYSAFHPVICKVLKMTIREFPRLVGHYCNYLLPKQALATHNNITKQGKQVYENRCTG